MAGPKTQALRILRKKKKRERAQERAVRYAENEANRLVVNGNGPWFVKACNDLLDSSHRSPKIEDRDQLTLWFRSAELGGQRRKVVLNGYCITRSSRSEVWVSSPEVSMILVKRGHDWFFKRNLAKSGGSKPQARSPFAGPTRRSPMHGHY